jgi:cyclopropane fatty-acyl-phospholipid synthase-like methyltransferase
MEQKEVWNTKWAKVTTTVDPSDFAQNVLQTSKPPGRLLELGAGSGKDSIFFAKQGFDVTAVDFSENSIQLIEKLSKEAEVTVTCILQDLDKLAIKDTFDVIYADLALQFFTDEQTKRLFTKIHTLLNKKGVLLARCKSTKDALCFQGEEIETNMFLLDGRIRHFFTKKYMKKVTKVFSSTKIKEVSHEQEKMDGTKGMSSCIEVNAQK